MGPEELPKGKILTSIFYVPCSQHTELSLIDQSGEVDVWAEDHEVLVPDGNTGRKFLPQRKKGDPVPGNLLKSWRECRRERPELFERGVEIVGAKKSYQNGENCLAHAGLLKKEFAAGCLHLVDMFSGEHTEKVQALDFCLNISKVSLGPKVTAKIQVTDVGLSKRGKDAQKPVQRKLRKSQRLKARLEGTAARLEAGCVEIMLQVNAMHDHWVRENEEKQLVLKTFRACGWLAYGMKEDGR